MAADCSVVLVTVPNLKTAEAVTDALLDQKLAACVNQIAGIKSSYWWEGKIDSAEEILLLIKTQTALIKRVMESVTQHHPYDVPEIIALPISEGSKAYLDWIKTSTDSPQAASSRPEKDGGMRQKNRSAKP